MKETNQSDTIGIKINLYRLKPPNSKDKKYKKAENYFRRSKCSSSSGFSQRTCFEIMRILL